MSILGKRKRAIQSIKTTAALLAPAAISYGVGYLDGRLELRAARHREKAKKMHFDADIVSEEANALDELRERMRTIWAQNITAGPDGRDHIH